METETVADIIARFRKNPNPLYWAGPLCFPEDAFMMIINRIEAAYKRETERLTAAYNGAATAYVSNAMEVKRLRRALKPVLEVHLYDGGQQVVSDALCAIREAQEIMK